MKCVYVAGPYSCDNRCSGPGVNLASMRKGIEACLKVLKHGMAPFCPWLDYLFVLMDHDNELPEKWYYEYSDAFLLRCDAMWVTGQRKNSIGVSQEIELAKLRGLPIFYKFIDLWEWNNAKSGQIEVGGV